MRTTLRRLSAQLIGLVVAVALMVSISISAGPLEPVRAANGADFNPGLIISDAVFYNGNTMTVAQIQTFLNAKVPSCMSGYTCLKSYRETTTNQTVKSEGCAAYTGQANESAALMIYKVAVSCGINPKAILVLLEKEQGLVTSTHPTASIYRKATGFGCPDTSVCDSLYYGFFNQVYQASYMFKKYQARPASRGYVAGRYNTILWNPNSACGSSSVYIQNQATAGLYIYTPYRPNAAALSNLYGTGSSCSAYGNRNFWRLFTDWFGSTGAGTIAVASALNTYYLANSSILGPATSNAVINGDGGIGQGFKYGSAYWSKATGAFRTSGDIGRSFTALKGPLGVLGYPTADPIPAPNGGALQVFQKGTMYWTSSVGSRYVPASMNVELQKAGGVGGPFGYPVANPTVYAAGGQGQQFQKSWLYWSAETGLAAVAGSIGQAYLALNGPAGVLGYPVGAEIVLPDGGRNQVFQKGTLYSLATLGPFYVPAALGAEFVKASGIATYGYPLANPTAYAGGGQGQRFQKSWLYWSTATGLDAVGGAIGQSYAAMGGPPGALGYPVAVEVAQPGGGRSRAFEKGTLYWSSSSGVRHVLASLDAEFVKQGGVSKFGYPVANPTVYADGGQGQKFQKSWLYWSTATGLDAVAGTLQDSYAAAGGPVGALGYPLAGEIAQPSGGRSQAFQKGTLYSLPTLGMFSVPASLDAALVKLGGVATYGYPVATAVVYADGGQGQKFQKSWLYWSAATGLDAVGGAIGQSYAAASGPAGVLGYPIAAEVAQPDGGRSRAFQKGSVYWAPARGAHYVLSSLGGEFVRLGGVAKFGYPVVNPTVYADGGQGQKFQKSWLYWSTATGLDAVGGAIGQAYAALNGSAGVLGYPVAAEIAQPNGGRSQAFQKGTMYSLGTVGTFYLPTSLGGEYLKLGGVAKFGYPVANPTVYADGGQGQKFQKSWLYWSTATGLDAVGGAIGQAYAAGGGPEGMLGYPVAAEIAQPDGGRSRAFKKGTLYWSPTLGVRYVLASLDAEFVKLGGVARFGYPVTNPTVYADGGQGQKFQKSWLYWSTATGLDAVGGAIGQHYAAVNGPAGVLGYPVSAEIAQPGGRSRAFQNGTVYWSSSPGARFVLASLDGEFAKLGGIATFGYPVANPTVYVDGGQGQKFQKSWLYWSTVTGLDAVGGAIGESYAALNGPAGVLGYPIAVEVAEPGGGRSRAFQKGKIYWSPLKGITVTVTVTVTP